MTGWRTSRVAAVSVIAVFFIVQLAIPISRIGDDDPRRFGWQMFSTSSQAPHFVVTTDTGEVEVDLADYMARVRGDIDIVSLMPPHLCNVIPGAESVSWEGGDFEC